MSKHPSSKKPAHIVIRRTLTEAAMIGRALREKRNGQGVRPAPAQQELPLHERRLLD